MIYSWISSIQKSTQDPLPIHLERAFIWNHQLTRAAFNELPAAGNWSCKSNHITDYVPNDRQTSLHARLSRKR